jgi:hypothetical protein
VPSANLYPVGGQFRVMDWANKWTAPLVGALVAACATSLAVAASAAPPLAPADPQIAARILDTHNAERKRLGLPELRWNGQLEREAGQWAHTLAQKGILQHADGSTRSGMGENLWMGTAGHWPVEDMVRMFIAEGTNFRDGTFPDISRTGNWADVGHYSQVVWRDTQEVGCAVVSGQGNDVLVCRYWPAGNVWGQRAY